MDEFTINKNKFPATFNRGNTTIGSKLRTRRSYSGRSPESPIIVKENIITLNDEIYINIILNITDYETWINMYESCNTFKILLNNKYVIKLLNEKCRISSDNFDDFIQLFRIDILGEPQCFIVFTVFGVLLLSVH